jgi:DNA (cytosine-5)-methyltransferase 1
MRKLPVNQYDRNEWMIVDNFAGGGGASTGIEMAIGRSPNVAINHDPEALAMHKANHPLTRHYEQNVWDIDPRVVVRNRRVGLAWFSPDCTHHSKARGGKPIRNAGKKSRSLAWVVVKWASHVRPRVIILENVEEFAQWGPVVKKVGDDGQPVIGADGMPLFAPCQKRRGATFRRWRKQLQGLGYEIEWKELRACDFGTPTVRKRLFVIARCDGQPIVWPEPTHGRPESAEVIAGTRQPWRTAAEIIDWSRACPSIFLSSEEAKIIGVNRPLADNTLKRIAAGLKRYVIESANPFIVSPAHSKTTGRGKNCWSLEEPLPTTTSSNDKCLIAPVLTREFGRSVGCDVESPAPTVMPGGGGKTGLVQAFLAQHNKGAVGHPATKPLSTIMGTGTQQQIVEASFFGSENTCQVNGQHYLQLKAFLQKYYGADTNHQDCRDPVHTVPTKDRFGVVTVDEVDYQIVDIGMRMLTSRELFRAQGFPDSYVIDCRAANKQGKVRPLPKDAQVRMCGNSVCPQLAAALVKANCEFLATQTDTRTHRQLELASI